MTKKESQIPSNSTCDDCRHRTKCAWLLGDGYRPQSTSCDWFPIRFTPRRPQQ